MSDIQENSVAKVSNILITFMFLFGCILSAICLIIAVEIMLSNTDDRVLQQLVQQYNIQLIGFAGKETFFDVFSLKEQLYREVLTLRWTLWAVPIMILSLMMTWIMGVSRNIITLDLLERLKQQRYVLTQERKRKKDAMVQLEKAEDHLHQIHEQLTESFMVINKDDRFHHLNRVCVQLLAKWNRSPKTARHYAEQPVETFIPDYHSSGLALCVRDAISKKLTWQKELFFERVNSWLQVRVYPAGSDAAYIYMRDISNEKKPEHLKRLGEDMVSSIAETSPYAIAIMDRQWNYLMVSKRWKDDFNFYDEDMLGKNHKAVLPSLPGKWQAVEGQLLEGKSVKSSGMPFHMNGKDEVISWEISPWRVGEKVQGFIMYADIVTDIQHDKQKLEQQREREHKLAYHDILTGLPNRQLFYDRLTMALAHGYRNLSKVGLFFLDLDGFKGINDNLGHDIGDMLLKEVASRLKRCVRDTDTVARLGGDEFTVILNGVGSEEDARLVAEKIIKSINEVFKLGEHDVYVSTSIGISMYPLDGSTSAELIKKADTAMYWSKEGGKNQANFFTKELNAGGASSTGANMSKKLEEEGDEKPVVTQRELESHIRTALQKNEIQVYFQPQFNQKEKRVVGLEALVRWQHPKAGLLEPRQFLNIAENTGMILPIGEKVLEEVAEKAKGWREMSKEPLVFAVNFSRRQLKDENIVSRIERVFKAKLIPFDWIVVEVSEKIVEEGDEVVMANIRAIAALGCKIYVDDFGLEYTSLQALEDLPLSGLKVHDVLVKNSINSTEDKTTVTSLVKLSQKLKVQLVAEGVETEDLAKFMASLGVDVIQGFVISKPEHPENVSKILS